MGTLRDSIRNALEAGRYCATDHADERLRERGIMMWQAVEGTLSATRGTEFPDARPFPKAEFEIRLADGVRIKADWSWSSVSGSARLVTVHFFDL